MRIAAFFLALLLFFGPPAGAAEEEEISAVLMLRAMQNCFPDKTGEIEFLGGDWTVKAGGDVFYWVGGRMLPAAEKNKAASYSPLPFEAYPGAAISPAGYSPEFIESLRLRGSAETRKNRPAEHRAFQAILYGGRSRREIEALLGEVEFLGKKIIVHRIITAAVKRLDAGIRAAAREEAEQGNRELLNFIASVGQAGGYNWRGIRGDRRMSYHSWGLAIDIQPKELNGKAIYWLWEQSRSDRWMLVPLSSRWKPPDRVIEAFEREGFTWGGKWPLYDNMHFEYRPELHEFNRLAAAETRAAAENTRPGQDLHHLYPEPQ